MKMFYLVLSVVIISLLIGCKDDSHDEVTGASKKKPRWLPQKDSTYEVVGYKKGLKGFVIQYSDSLFRGGNILSAEGAKFLQKSGIQTVISVTPDENITTLCNSFSIAQESLYYDYGDLSDSTIKEFLKVLDNAAPPLYIHCFSGKQRAGLLCAIARIYWQEWSLEKAEAEYDKLGGKVKEDHPLLVCANEIIKEVR